ncbi:MAG: Ppx/GppA family phosphatase [Aestuariivita sp.]|nr:Ppx/GppA family phosphatase [Aestuariivita sp.]
MTRNEVALNNQQNKAFFTKQTVVLEAKSRALYGALDLGTNSCRMLIAEPREGGFNVVDSFSKLVRLGEGLEITGQLSDTSIERTIRALKICKRKLECNNVSSMRLVATEACRRARNADTFVAKVLIETGLEIDIIEAEEEARLAVISCAPLVSEKTEQLLVIDIGGGSTELVWIDLNIVPKRQRKYSLIRLQRGFQIDGAQSEAQVVDWISVPLGVSTLRDQFQDVDDDVSKYALMSWYFEENLMNFSLYDYAHKRQKFQIIGTSGTITTLAACYLGLQKYERTKVDGLEMTTDQIEGVINRYLEIGVEGRRNEPLIGQERHASIMSGCAILQSILRLWPTDKLTVADRGLRESLLYAQMMADDVIETKTVY